MIDTQDSTQQPDPSLSKHYLGVAVALAVMGLAGFASSVAVGEIDSGRLYTLFMETGISPPWAFGFGRVVRVDVLAPVTGVLGAAVVAMVRAGHSNRGVYACLTLGLIVDMLLHGLFRGPMLAGALIAAGVVGGLRLAQPLRTQVIAIGLGLTVTLLVILNAAGMYALKVSLDLFGGVQDTGPALEPGRGAEVAEQVVRALRASARRGVGTFEAAEGRRGRYLRFSPPKGEAPSGPLPPLAELSGPELLLLPWGAAGNSSYAQEQGVFFPGELGPGRASGGALAAGGPWTVDEQDRGSTEVGTPAIRFPAVLPMPGYEGYSYALQLRRARLAAGAEPSSEITSQDPYVDGLLEVRVVVFRGFDPAATGDTIPRSNVPIYRFVTLVGL